MGKVETGNSYLGAWGLPVTVFHGMPPVATWGSLFCGAGVVTLDFYTSTHSEASAVPEVLARASACPPGGGGLSDRSASKWRPQA